MVVKNKSGEGTRPPPPSSGAQGGPRGAVVFDSKELTN